MTEPRPSPISLFFHFVATWLRDALRTLRVLWLEVTGGIFIGLALFGVPSAAREWRIYQEGGTWHRLASVVVFLAMMAVFGVYSFWRARRMR